jgi:AcrR family transcriptional regulator
MELSLRERQKKQTRNEILQATWTLWERDGMADTKLSEIASLAGVSEQTLYNHFPSKDALALALLDDWRTFGDFTQGLEAVSDELGPADALLELIRHLDWPDTAAEQRALDLYLICSRDARLRAAYVARAADSGHILVEALTERAARHHVTRLRLELMVTCFHATFDVVARHQPLSVKPGRWKRDLMGELERVMGAFR